MRNVIKMREKKKGVLKEETEDKKGLNKERGNEKK